MTSWQILTGEYPPQPGGVSDYTRTVARALAAEGDRVDVWAPPCEAIGEFDAGVTVRRLPDHFGRRSLSLLDRALDAMPEPRRLLVQYVPQAFGWKAINVPFCLWLRSRRRDSIWVMFHEVAVPMGMEFGVSGNALGAITRWMASIVGRAAERTFVSIPGWEPVVRTLAGINTPISWLPVPSSIHVAHDPIGTAHVRSRLGGEGRIVGHLGTYGSLIEPMLAGCLLPLLSTTDCRVLLLGRGGEVMARSVTAAHPDFADRLYATGELSPEDLSRHVSACDVMVQPYPDGVSSRRTSVMACLSHARPIVTTTGALTEPLWGRSGAVVLVPADDLAGLARETANLLTETVRRSCLAARAETLYAECFDVARTVSILRSEDSVSSFAGVAG